MAVESKSTSVVYAEEVEIPNAWQRLWDAFEDPAYRLKKLTLWMRVAQIVLGLTSVILSTCYDLPKGIPIKVRSAGIVLIDAGTIKSMFAFPAYVYLAVVAVITFLGAILFLLLLVVDLSLAKV